MKKIIFFLLTLFASLSLFSQELDVDDRVTITQNIRPYIGVFAFGYQGSSNPGYPQFQLNNYGGTPGAATATSDNSILGTFAFSGHNGTAKKTVGVFRVKSMTDFSNTLSSRMDFLLGPNREQRMTILGDNGFVGIGTESPETQLHISSGQATNAVASSSLVDVVIEDEDWSYLEFKGGEFGGTSFNDEGQSIYAGTIYDYFSNKLYFKTGGVSERMLIDSDGQVGIGLSSPTEKLDVNGNVRFRNNLRVDDRLVVNDDGTNSSLGRVLFVRDYLSTTAAYIKNPGSIGASLTNGTALLVEGSQFGIDIIMNESDADGDMHAIRTDNFTNTAAVGLLGNHYGIKAYASGKRNSASYGNFSIFGEEGQTAGNGTNWAGYFSGDVRITGTLDNTSDRKLKKDIKELEGALDIIQKLKPMTYLFRTDEYPNIHLDERPQVGFIAQDMEKVLPNLVRSAYHPEHKKRENDDRESSPAVEIKSINYTGVIPVLAQGIKELDDKHNAKNAEIEAVKAENEKLKMKNEELEQKLDEMSNILTEVKEQFSKYEEGLKAYGLENTNTPQKERHIVLNGDGSTPILGQNAPNPFNQKTLINYYLPDNTSSARMVFSDINGKTLKTVDISGHGFGRLSLKAGELIAGTYIYTLFVNGNKIASKQMVLVE